MDNNKFNGEQPDMSQTGYGGQPDMSQQVFGGQPDMSQQVFGGQPDMSQQMYGQDPYNMNSVYGQSPVPPQNPGKKPKKPMTKGKLGAIIGGSIAAVAAVVCGVIFLPRLFKSDKEVVLDAVNETFAYYKTESPEDDDIGMDDIQKAFLEKGGQSTADYTISIADGDDTLAFGMVVDAARNVEKKLISSDVKMTIGDAEFISAECYADQDNTYVALPELFDGYFSLPNKNPLGALANSPAGESMDMEASELPSVDFNYFPSDEKSGDISSSYVDAFETVWDAAEFEKQGKAKITVNDETVTAKEYFVTWSKEDLQDACKKAIDGLEQTVIESGTMLDEMDMSEEDFKNTMEQLKSMVPSIITSDLQVKVYVKDGRAVKITSADSVSLMGMVNIDYDFYFDAGENDITASLGFGVAGSKAGIKYEAHDVKGNTNGKIVVFADDEEIGIDFEKNVVQSGDTETTTYKISAADICSIEMTENQYADHKFDYSITADIVGVDTITATLQGGFTDLQKGVAYTIQVDSFDVKVANESICTGNAKISVDTSNTTVKERDASAPVHAIAEMTESEWDDLASKSEDKLVAWVDRLSKDESFQHFLEFFGGTSQINEGVEEDEPEEATSSDAGKEEVTAENAVLEADNGVQYKVNGTINGFNFWYGDDDVIEFDTSAYSMLNYSLEEADASQTALDDVFTSWADTEGYEMTESNYNQTIQIDGKDVLYSFEKYYDASFETNIMDVSAVVEVEPGVYMTINSEVYTDDDPFTVEDILQALSSQYYEKVQ